MGKQKEISLVAYSKIREACSETLTEDENQWLLGELLKGSKTISAKYKLMLKTLLTKAYGGDPTTPRN